MSKKNRKNIIFIVIILALIGYILYDKGVFAKLNLNSNNNSEQVLTPEEDNTKTTTENKTTETKTVTSKEMTMTKLEKCEVDVLKEVTDKKTDYTKGSILVSFLADVEFVEAKKIIKDLGYSIPSESSVETKFESGQKWFVAKVGTGNEFEAICKLREYSDVKYVWIEPLLEIHE
jgi:hypothetical protein